MTRNTLIPHRLMLAALLHTSYVFFLYHHLFGGRGQSLLYYPNEPLLLIGATCGVGVVILAPVIFRGDGVERAIAVALLVLPVCGLLHTAGVIHRMLS